MVDKTQARTAINNLETLVSGIGRSDILMPSSVRMYRKYVRDLKVYIRQLERELEAATREEKKVVNNFSSTDRWDDEPQPGTIGYLGRERSRGGEDMGW